MRRVATTMHPGKGLDEKAIDAVEKWKFQRGTKEGVPVAVQFNIEVNFHLK
jgi:TonB family protein